MEAETRRVFELFVENAYAVRSSSFFNVIRERGGLRLSVQVGPVETTISPTAPNGDEISALVTMLRKFELGSEPASFKALARLAANDNGISSEWKEHFTYCSEEWQRERQQPTRSLNVAPIDQILTRGELLDNFIYGGLVKDDKDKRLKVQQWKESGMFYEVEFAFHSALLDLWKWEARLVGITEAELQGSPIPSLAECLSYAENNRHAKG